jgi:hypothetical protein
MFATRLAERVGLPVPRTEIVEVGESLIKHTPDLYIQLQHGTVQCKPGLQFGSRYVVNPLEGQVFDYLPIEMLFKVRNSEFFAGMLVLDKWTGNVDRRQATFWRKSQERKYTVTFIDQGLCFNGGQWNFPDDPSSGVYPRNEVYDGVQGWQSFEPWLSRIQDIQIHEIWEVAKQIPVEWYDEDSLALEKLVEKLFARRELIRGLIELFRISPQRPFAQWAEPSKFAPASARTVAPKAVRGCA